jgi:hypothetical protein
VRPLSQPEHFVSRHRFIFLFWTLVVFYVLVPILHRVRHLVHPGLPPVAEGILFVAVLTGAMLSVTGRRALILLTSVLGVVAVALKLVYDVVRYEKLSVVMHLVVLGFLLEVIWLMLRHIFACRRVTFNTVCASLCIYLLLGMVWALAYSVVDVMDPGAFRATDPARTTPLIMRVGQADTAVLYFSFSTLTTLGYGDIVPTSPISRMLASVEAIAGQLYLAVLVSRLVGLHIAESIDQRMGNAPKDDPDAV